MGHIYIVRSGPMYCYALCAIGPGCVHYSEEWYYCAISFHLCYYSLVLIIAHIRKGDQLLGQLFYSLISDEAMLGIILNFQVQRLMHYQL